MRTGIDRSTSAESRARLWAAAVQAFAARGFHGTTTRDIAAAAGMSPAALYVHHRSKEELLHLISKTGHERVLGLFRASAATSEDPVEQLRRVVRDFAEYHAQHHTTARVVNSELAALSPEHQREIAEVRRAIDRELRALVESGVRAGVFDVSDVHMAATVLGSLGIDVARWYRDDRSWTPQDIGDYYGELALRIVGARRAGTGQPSTAGGTA
jgi:AcrR family transcriptional regulator